MSPEILKIVLFVGVGIVLIVVEILFVPGTTFVGVIGFCLMAWGIWQSSQLYGVFTGAMVGLASLIVLVCTFYLGYKKGVWKNFALRQNNDVQIHLNLNKKVYVGQLGHSISALRPTGTAHFEQHKVEVQTFGEFLESNMPIKIIEIKGNEIFVASV